MANKMFLASVILAVIAFHTTEGKECMRSGSDLPLAICPIPLLGDESKSYCCWHKSDITASCCNLPDYMINFVTEQYPAYFIGGVIGACVVFVWLACCRR